MCAADWLMIRPTNGFVSSCPRGIRPILASTADQNCLPQEPSPMQTTLEHPSVSTSKKLPDPALDQIPPPGRSWYSPAGLWNRKTTNIAALCIVAILLHVVLRFAFRTTPGTYQ